MSFTTLYPNAAQPRHGIFVEQRLRHLVAGGGVEARVLAPVPWFPFGHRAFGRYADYARVPQRELRHGIEVLHPRYTSIPKVGMELAPALLTRAMRPWLRKLLDNGACDAIDAHYLYPDGVAAVRLGAGVGLPVVLTARGSDVNVLAELPGPRRRIVAAANDAAALVTVSADLRRRLVEHGVPAEKIHVIRNGVDTTLFRETDRAAARREFGVDGRVLLSVGNLVEAKGHHLAIDALAELADTTLIVAGTGPAERSLRSRAAGRQVIFAGAVDHERMHRLYSAADALVLASAREGIANVVLESLACGTPVVATAVGGLPEVIDDDAAGVLIAQRSAAAVARGVDALFAAYPGRDATRRLGARFDWKQCSDDLRALFNEVVSRAMPAMT